jgi:hypothetical protein
MKQNGTEKVEKKDFKKSDFKKKPDFKGDKKPNKSGKPNNDQKNNNPHANPKDNSESYRPFALFFKKDESGKYEFVGKNKK